MSDDKSPSFLTVRELAALLRVRERKIYDLAAAGAVPCSRVTGKLLFPREAIDRWLAAQSSGTAARPRAAVFAGSHDPLLEWALKASGAGLATFFDGSSEGIERFERRDAVATALHVLSADNVWNVPAVRDRFADENVVLIGFAERQRGFLVRKGEARRYVLAQNGKRNAGRSAGQEAGGAIGISPGIGTGIHTSNGTAADTEIGSDVDTDDGARIGLDAGPDVGREQSSATKKRGKSDAVPGAAGGPVCTRLDPTFLLDKRIAIRQAGSGSQILLERIVADAGLCLDEFAFVELALSESDAALAVLDGRVDVALGLSGLARQHGLDFIPLLTERFDLLIDRADSFEASLQVFFEFCRTQAFHDKATSLGGYDVTCCGKVRFNASS